MFIFFRKLFATIKHYHRRSNVFYYKNEILLVIFIPSIALGAVLIAIVEDIFLLEEISIKSLFDIFRLRLAGIIGGITVLIIIICFKEMYKFKKIIKQLFKYILEILEVIYNYVKEYFISTILILFLLGLLGLLIYILGWGDSCFSKDDHFLIKACKKLGDFDSFSNSSNGVIGEIIERLGIAIGGIIASLVAVTSFKRARAADKTAEEQEKGNFEERYKNAVEQLGKNDSTIRIAGIYGLYHLAREHSTYRRSICDVLCTYVRKKRMSTTKLIEHSDEVQKTLDLLTKKRGDETMPFLSNWINFEGTSLEGFDLDDSYLEGAHLRSVKFKGASLSNTKLQGADLQSANLESIRLDKAHLEGVNFSKANLKHANLNEANLKYASFYKANLKYANLSSIDIGGADFSEANLESSNLSKSKFKHTILFYANLKNANLRKANFKFTNLHGANLKNTYLQHAFFEEIKIKCATAEGAFFVGGDLMLSHFEATKLKNAHLEVAKLDNAYFEGADLRGAHLEGSCLSKAHFEGAKLKGANLQCADLRGAYLEGADLSEAHLEGANLNGARLIKTNLENAHLEGANLNKAKLQGANLGGADIRGIDASNNNFGDENPLGQGQSRLRARVGNEANFDSAIFQGGVTLWELRNFKRRKKSIEKKLKDILTEKDFKKFEKNMESVQKILEKHRSKNVERSLPTIYRKLSNTEFKDSKRLNNLPKNYVISLGTLLTRDRTNVVKHLEKIVRVINEIVRKRDKEK